MSDDHLLQSFFRCWSECEVSEDAKDLRWRLQTGSDRPTIKAALGLEQTVWGYVLVSLVKRRYWHGVIQLRGLAFVVAAHFRNFVIILRLLPTDIVAAKSAMMASSVGEANHLGAAKLLKARRLSDRSRRSSARLNRSSGAFDPERNSTRTR